ncbi:hypothetical protein ACEPAI_9354 [Sanghuangporus weigelae]
MHMPQNSIHFARKRPFTRLTVAPLGSGFFVVIAVLFSLLFIFSASLAFANHDAAPRFRDILNTLSAQQSGITILGENVDVDVDEPSVTIRWSVLGCGTSFFLSGSPTLHDSKACGLPAIPLEVFLEGSDAPSFTYDPENVPVNQKSGQYIVTQAQVQFDDDIVLDVHDTRLYPFDTYLVSTSLRVTSSNSSMKDIPISIIGIPVIKQMPSFTMSSLDTDISIIVEEDKFPGKHFEIQIKRPAHARLCGIAFLTILQRNRVGSKEMLKRVLGAHAILIVIPQLRATMPDAPGLDGVLIDTIGYFPQMTLAAFSAIVLLLITAKREMDGVPAHITFTRHRRAQSTLSEEAISGVESRIIHTGRAQGHSRKLSMRDYMMEQVLKVLDAGSQALRENSSKARERLSVGASGSSNGGIGGSSRKTHFRSGSYHELGRLPL